MNVALGRSLAALEHTLQRAGASVARRLRPGIDATTVRSLIEPLGLSPSDEFIEWFGWHDGAEGAGVDLVACSLLPGAVFYDLRTLCREYTEARQDFDEVVASLPSPPPLASSDLWNPSWFPLLRLWAGYVAVDLGGTDAVTSPVHVVWFDDPPECRNEATWPTMDAFVVEVLKRLATGIYSVDQDGVIQGPDVDAS